MLTPCSVLDHINGRDLETAMDILSQRIVAIQTAKQKGGSWDKANRLELVTALGDVPTASGFQKLAS